MQSQNAVWLLLDWAKSSFIAAWTSQLPSRIHPNNLWKYISAEIGHQLILDINGKWFSTLKD